MQGETWKCVQGRRHANQHNPTVLTLTQRLLMSRMLLQMSFWLKSCSQLSFHRADGTTTEDPLSVVDHPTAMAIDEPYATIDSPLAANVTTMDNVLPAVVTIHPTADISMDNATRTPKRRPQQMLKNQHVEVALYRKIYAHA